MSWIVLRWKLEWAGPFKEFQKKPGSERYWNGEDFVKGRALAKPFKWPHIARIVARAYNAEIEKQ